jgi:hypothetical protein
LKFGVFLTQTRPATAVHPETGDEVWCNQADGFHPSALYPGTYAEMLAICGCEENFRLNVLTVTERRSNRRRGAQSGRSFARKRGRTHGMRARSSCSTICSPRTAADPLPNRAASLSQ